MYMKWLNTKEPQDGTMYKREQAILRRMVIQGKKNMWDNKCKEVYCYLDSHRKHGNS
jgi:hypothetical protein